MSCCYCKGEKSLIERGEHFALAGDFYAGIEVCIDKDTLSVDSIADVYEPNFTEDEVKIHYCPMCGQKLKIKEEVTEND